MQRVDADRAAYAQRLIFNYNGVVATLAAGYRETKPGHFSKDSPEGEAVRIPLTTKQKQNLLLEQERLEKTLDGYKFRDGLEELQKFMPKRVTPRIGLRQTSY